MKVKVKSICQEAPGINSYELRPVEADELPAFDAGAHIDLHLRDGLVRSYSLINDPAERHRYVIGVSLDRRSRGGSRHIHERIRVGDVIPIEGPRNNFGLVESAAHTILVGGGIGITPLLSMVRRLETLGASWSLHYAIRSRGIGAFLDLLAAREAACPGRVHVLADEENGGRAPDLRAIVAQAPPQAHFYCCGPAPMLAAFLEAATDIPPQRIHLERFSGEQPAAAGGFQVVLARSGRRIDVPPESSILRALLEAGVDVHYSCEQGVCGACETRVLSGEPVHRDSILSEEERAAGQTMMICCSGCASATLELDL